MQVLPELRAPARVRPMCSRATRIGILCACACAYLAGETRPEAPILKDARAILRISDGQSLERELSQVVSACGNDPVSQRTQMAEALYLSSSLDAVDLQRPALIAWRDGPSPLVAIIPVSDRPAFMDGFGVLPFGEAPLVRIGDREGTIVFTQNLADRHDEYRLLITNNTAYLARSAEECATLAEHPLTDSGEEGSLSYSTWGPFPQGLGSGLPVEIPDLGCALPKGLSGLLALGSKALPGLVSAQLTDWSWQLKVDNNTADWTGTAELDPQGSIASWLRGQSSQALTMSPALPDSCVLRATCIPSWTGQWDSIGHGLLDQAKAVVGARWNPTMDEAWGTLFPACDHSAALSLGVAPHATGPASWLVTVDHPNADVLAAQFISVVGQWAGETTGGDATAGWSLSAPGATLAVQHLGRTLLVAGGESDAGALLQGAAGHLDDVGQAGPTALAWATYDLRQLVKTLYSDRIEPEAELPGVQIVGEAKSGHDQILLHANLPIADTISLLNKVNWK